MPFPPETVLPLLMLPTSMNNLVYLSYGTGQHIDELVYSVMTVAHVIGRNNAAYRMIVCTDDPVPYRGLPVHLELVKPEVLADWGGPFNFGHRKKIFAIKQLLGKFGDRIVFCDADTFFTKHPLNVFERVRPGHTVMHIGEYQLSHRCVATLADFVRTHELRDLAGHRWNIPAQTVMFNSGVIGIHSSDIRLLDDVAHLSDQIYPHVQILTIEQFAFSVVFQQRSKLHQAYNSVHHYWKPDRRAAFHKQLDRVLHDPSISSSTERIRRLSPYRPSRRFKDRPFKGAIERGLKARTHNLLWRIAVRTGLLDPMKRIEARIKFNKKSNSAGE
jgi:hypothetical protein